MTKLLVALVFCFCLFGISNAQTGKSNQGNSTAGKSTGSTAGNSGGSTAGKSTGSTSGTSGSSTSGNSSNGTKIGITPTEDGDGAKFTISVPLKPLKR